MLSRLAGTGCAALLTAGIASAAPPDAAPAAAPVPHVPIASGDIRVDGRLDEPAWADALELNLRYETWPGDDVKAPVETTCRLLRDAARLYVGCRAQDPDPAAIRAFLADRDNLPEDEDQIQIVLDTFLDQRRAYVLAASPLGVQRDAIASEVGGVGLSYDRTWDALWSAAGSVDDGGWTLEIALPFASLRFPRAGDGVWGLHLERTRPRSVSRTLSLQPIDRNNACYLCQEARIGGFTGLRPGRDLEIDPTFTATREDASAAVGAALERGPLTGKVGGTVRWGVAPDLMLGAAINPDFSTVEADVAQLTINRRFALYYPEKRPLFLEGADFFQTRLTAVHTRTIADPAWGTRLVGKTGKSAIGVVAARDDITNLIVPANQQSFSTSLDLESTDAIVRLRRDIAQASTVGVLLTGRSGGDYANGVAGLDTHLRFTPSDSLSAQVLASRTRYPDGFNAQLPSDLQQPEGFFGGAGASAGYQHESRAWNWGAYASDLGERLRLDSGFLPRADTRSFGGSVERVFWGGPGGTVRWSVGATGSRTTNHEGVLTDEANGVFASWDGPLQSSVSLDLNRGREFFAGTTYDLTYGSASFYIAPHAAVSLALSGDFGDEVDYDNCRPGRVTRVTPSLAVKAGRHLRVTVDETWEALDVEGGRLYRASLAQTRLAWQMSVRAQARLIVQYTDIAREPDLYLTSRCSGFVPPPPPLPGEPESPPRLERTLFTQALFSYKVNPQTALYVGTTSDRLGDETTSLAETGRTWFFKIGYAFLP